MSFTKFHSISPMIYDPALAPTKAIQNIQALDDSHWQQQPRARFDTTYRTEFINRIRHPDSNIKAKPISRSSLNQYSVLPPISTVNTQPRNVNSARSTRTDLVPSIKNPDVPINEPKSNDMPPINLNNGTQNFYQQPFPPPPQLPPPMMKMEDTYLPAEPVLLTDYEEERLAEQIRTQLGNSTNVEKLKLFYQELAAYDPNVISYVHYSNIQLVASQIGLNVQEDTLRFAMCKFVAPERGRGFVHYEDMIRYFGKCLSSVSANVYGLSNSSKNFNGYRQTECPCRHEHNPYFQPPCPIHHPYP